jgi:serine/threonine protein kinase
MSVPQKLKGRYEIREVLGQGGMGLVYRAYDAVVRREVALKTLRDAPNRTALQMFYKECEVLAALSHPNIVEIFDIGEFEEDGKSKPYFVMPLLPGAPLDKLIRASSHRLTVERVVDILCQTCRGLHAAHERGLVHRDIKPSNLFVMDDDSLKVIDFGVAHMVESGLSVGAKGTLLYMAPEQLQMKPATPASDVYSLGVVAFEALTRRRAFEAPNETEIVDAVLHRIPPPACDLNPAVSQILSRVIHKAMAKQPWNRYASAREFADTLLKAMRNEPIEFFNPARIQPRIERAQKAFDQGDLQFAAEILAELEAEGHIDPALVPLRRQIEHSARQKTISQLLESARTRFEHEEYPLSLQKIQEILQLDPANAQALGLKASIENRLVNQKIEDWLRLAKQHLENQAYTHAREAVRNVLDLKPAETRGMQLMAEVDQLEQDYLRARKEKEELYHSALDAFNCGEVTSALGKLERVLDLDARSPDKSSPDRAAAYHNFYNKVRSEHDSIKNSYDEARKHLESRNFAPALAIANEFLAKYPDHALFQALKFDIEEQQRQELSARIAAIDREVEAEPDLDRRVSILEQAVAQYPGEPHFERQIKPMREKRDLVNSIAAKARYYEEQRQFNEALAQWEILRTIYSQYPGLEFEIERVTKRRDQQTRTEARAGWLDQIDRAMQGGFYAKAGELAQAAEAEFPADAELAQLKQAASEAAGRAEEAQKLLAQGQSLVKQAWFEEGFGAMNRARELDPRNAAIRQALLEALIERARALIDSDLAAAEPLIQQALDLDPNNALAKSLRTTALDHKRDQVVIQTFTQARQMRASGDLEAALGVARQGLAKYPSEPRLMQLRDVLARELDAARPKDSRPADLERIRELGGSTPAEVEKLREALARAQEIAERYPGDAEFNSAVEGIAQRLSAAFAAAEAAKPAEPQPAAPEKAETPPAAPAEVRTAAPQPTPAPPKPAAPPPKPQAQPKRAAKRPPAAVIVAGVAIVLVLVLAGVFLISRKGSQPAAAVVPVEVQTTPPGAVIRVNGRIRGTSDFKLEVEPGTYQIEASLDGYGPASASVEVGPQSAAPVRFTLEPLPQTVRVITDLTEGKAALDGQPPQNLQEGQFVFDGVPPGKHTVKLSARGGEAAFTFELAAGAAPVISGPPAVKNFSAVLMAGFGTRARLYSTMVPAKAELDGAPAGEIGAEGLALEKLQPGPHELLLSDGKTQLKKIIETGPAPVITAFIQSDQNIGTLVIMAGQDNADVYIDGMKYRRQTSRGGQLRIAREPGRHRVRVVKPGFQDAPEQVAEIRKGEETKVAFTLVAVPTTGKLALQGAAAGAQVLLDQAVIGTVGADGSFEYGGVAPGEHSVELRNGRMRSKPARRNFSAGEEVRLAAADLAMRSSSGTLRVTASPGTAQVSVARNGGQPQPVIGGSIELDEGSYTVTARAQGYVPRTERVQVNGGQTASLELTLVRERVAKASHGMEDWENPKAWTSDGEWFVHKGEGVILYKPMPVGSYAFNIIMTRGKNIEWVVDYKDDRNYTMFRLDKENFRRILCVNGKKTEAVKKPHGLDMKDYLMASVQIELTPNAVVQRVQKNGQWVVLDNWTIPDEQAAEGRFGVSVPGGRDEVRISGFGFYPKE